MDTLIEQRRLDRINRIIAWLVRWRYWVFGAITLSIIVAEYIEYITNRSRSYHFNFTETALYLIFILVIGFLLESLIKANEGKSHAYTMLRLKHLLAQKLSEAEDWQELTDHLSEFVGGLATDTIVDLLIPDQDSADLEIFTSGEPEAALNRKAEFCGFAACYQVCCLRENNILHAMNSCEASQALQSAELLNGYCLPLYFGDSRIAILQLYLAPASSLSNEQMDILNNIGSEIALALRIVQQRIALSKHLVSDTTASTRREISHDLHDTLGQNLSYLQFKLDQFTRDDALVEVSEIKSDLLRMHATARDSLELLRDTLIGLQPGNESRLANFLHDHGKSVGERANFDLQFNTTGTPLPLTSSPMRQIFYIYREALNNIERHACADRVEVQLNWGVSALQILIADNGKGFNPEHVQNDQHYGIKIMQERMAALNGSVCIESSEGAGTRLTINLPFVA